MSKRNIVSIIKISVVSIIVCMFTISANELVYAQNGGSFSIRAVIPDNQVDTRQTYFDLRMEPGAKQTIQVVIDNPNAEDLTARIQLNPASTGRDGLIVYSESDTRDEKLKVAITDVASLESETVVVPAAGSTTVNIDIQMPEEELDGTILGGIVVTEENTQDNTQVENNNVSLTNTITYVIGLKITENDNEIIPDFEFVSISPELINHKTSMVAVLRNNAPLIVKDMEVNAQVYKSGSDTPLHELSLSNAEMAPLSSGDFVISWNDTTLAAGTYRLVMSATYNGQEWKWDEEFVIAGEAKTINKEAVGLKRDYKWLYISSAIVGMLIIGVVAYQVGKRKKMSIEQNKIVLKTGKSSCSEVGFPIFLHKKKSPT